MSGPALWLDNCVLLFFLITTVLLAIGCGLMSLMRAPACRQRTGELTLAAVFGWWVLACLPLPRLLPEHLWAQPVGRATSDVDRGSSMPSADELELASLSAMKADDALLEIRQSSAWNQELAPAAPLDGVAVGRSQPDADRPSDAQWGDGDAASHPPAIAGTAVSPIATFYLGGAAVCVLWLVCGRVRLARIRQTARRPPKWLADMFAGLADEAGVRPLLLVSRGCRRPMSWGTWRPTIVLPVGLTRRRHREQLRMVLLHELAHVVRRDGWGNVLVCLALPLLYPHPLFLWLRAQLRMAAELLADDWAAQRGGKLAYVEQLVSLARSSGGSPTLLPAAGAVTLYSSSSQFYRRMQMLIARPCPLSVVPTARWRFSSLAAAALVTAAAASLAGVRPASGQQPPAQNPVAASPPEDPTKAAQTTAAPDSARPVDTAQPNPLEKIPYVGRLLTAAEVSATENRADAEEQALRAKLTAAEEQIRLLKAQLKEAGAAPASGKATTEQPSTITITHGNPDGSTSHETWTLRQWAADPSKPGEKTTRFPDGRIVKEFREKDGTVTTHVYDRQTGRFIETKQGTDPLKKPPYVGWLFTAADNSGAKGRAQDEAQVRSIEAQSKEAGGKPEATPASGEQAAITLTRVAEDGSIWHEIWTTSADGRPEKLVARTPGRPAEPLLTAAKTSVLPDGRIMKQFTRKDAMAETRVYDPKEGTVTETRGGTTIVYDSKTARLIEMRSVADPAAVKSAAGAEQTTSTNKSAADAGSSTKRPGRWSIGLDYGLPSAGATGTETAGLDLVKLATYYADAIGAVEEAEATVAEIETSSSDRGLGPAKAALRSARRKQELLRHVASVAADATRTELERAQQLLRAGAPAAQQSATATAAESRLKVLNAILQSGSTGNVDPKQPGESTKP
jgi:beta-lactamase regulating signal transducer with metallopeptidase domain